MTDEEIDLLLVELEELLSDLNLDFIVVQERVTAAEGVSKLASESGRRTDVDSFYSNSTSMDATSTGTVGAPVSAGSRASSKKPPKQRLKNNDVLVATLDNRARLTLLLDLIEAASAGTLAMESCVHDEIAGLRDLASGAPKSAGDFEVDAAQGEWGEFWDGTVVFTDPPEAELRSSGQEPWQLASDAAFAEKVSRVRTVVELLDSLRVATGLSRGEWLARNASDDGGEVWSFTRGVS
jgi:hypothetical protein